MDSFGFFLKLYFFDVFFSLKKRNLVLIFISYCLVSFSVSFRFNIFWVILFTLFLLFILKSVFFCIYWLFFIVFLIRFKFELVQKLKMEFFFRECCIVLSLDLVEGSFSLELVVGLFVSFFFFLDFLSFIDDVVFFLDFDFKVRFNFFFFSLIILFTLILFFEYLFILAFCLL